MKKRSRSPTLENNYAQSHIVEANSILKGGGGRNHSNKEETNSMAVC